MTEDHQIAFWKVKDALVRPPVLATFESNKETRINTDASRKNGLGFCLIQLHETKWRILQSGSFFLSPTENHHPLREIFNEQQMGEIENLKLQKIKSALQTNYQFQVRCRKGSEHKIKDALSQNPVDEPGEEDTKVAACCVGFDRGQA
ncbi:hypothetical protein TCAL_05741 [Tigriopus californicus]|uniref:Reverse transcriptase/retrotransposon-derived protein RNase H-like domain-containing protein n=1 Tax=Tigriopus californicus TaxID=6832 RepID=A0A553N890_TIGCA|nr:hypothetical protein TCAL_05741 [Tigriopus californicus]